jgi:predicted permease
MRTIPAVSSIAMTNRLPYAGGNTRCEFWVEGVVHDPRDEDTVDCRRISADLFTTMRIPVVAGRTFNADDRRDTLPVAIVNRSLAERYWPAQDPIGRRFKGAENGQWITVVGVVGDVLHDWFMQRRDPTFYRPMTQDTPFGHWFVARTIGDPTSIASELRRAIAAVDPDQPVSDLKSMDELIEDRTSGLQFIARALTIVAIIAFALAMTGLYSLMAFMAARRTQEIGVRIALGANRWQVIRIATAPAVWITAGGITIGGLLAASLGQLMASVLRGGVAANFWYLGVLILLLAIVALTAAYLPARRAAAIDPTVALRAE